MKKFLTVLLSLCLIFTGFLFVGCTNNEIVLNGGPAFEDKIYGNGGMVVTKGDYVYFTDSYIKSSSLGSSTTVSVKDTTEAGLYRAKMTTEIVDNVETAVLTDVELMVKKVVGFENSGLYIFKDKIYFASPSTISDKTGVRYDLLTFFRCNLDGSNVEKFYQTEEFSSGKFSMTMIDETVYLMVYTGSDVIVVSENGTAKTVATEVTSVIFPSRTTVINNEENPISSECFVYYTKDKEQEGSIETGNILYKAEIKTGSETELLNEERVSVTLKDLSAGNLLYVRNTIIGSTSVYGYYKNSLANTNFLNGETKLVSLNSSSTKIIALGTHNGTNLGYVEVTASNKVVVRNEDGTGKVVLEPSSAPTIICCRNGYLYYRLSSTLYRISLIEEDAKEEKLNDKVTPKTEYFDIDEDYFYFFAENKEKSNKLSIYRVDLDAETKKPTLIK